jgi:predicted house-cleaning noncanonical NTP pyrophosphatase (MazG superfamily)
MIKKYNKFVEDRLLKEDVQVVPEEIQNSIEEAPVEEPIQELEEDDEEEGYEYIGDQKMKELGSLLGTDKNENGAIVYNGKEVNFYSETEKFHVDNKKFNTAEEVVEYLNGAGDKHKHRNRPVEQPEEEERLDPEFEAKSYRHSREFKRRLK